MGDLQRTAVRLRGPDPDSMERLGEGMEPKVTLSRNFGVLPTLPLRRDGGSISHRPTEKEVCGPED